MKIELYDRYIDDIDLILRSIGRDVKFCPLAGNFLKKSEDEIKADEHKNEDEITMTEARKIADTCMEMLETESDYPSNHPELENKVPILDMAVWMEEVELPAQGLEDMLHSQCRGEYICLPIGIPPKRLLQTEGEVEMEAQPTPASRLVLQVYYQFYRKPMAQQRVILASSALPWQQKRTALTQELIRRLLRTKKELNCKVKQIIISEFMQLLKNSGYDKKFRCEILQSGLKGYNSILEADRVGKKPLYRSRQWRKSPQGLKDQKRRKQNKWLGETYKSFIFVPPTPGAELKRRMQAKEKELRPGGRDDWPIRIIEGAGNTVERVLVKTDPFNGNQCNDAKCLPNKSETSKISCRKNNICYEIKCKFCPRAGNSSSEEPDTYFGETARNFHTRMKEHLTIFNSKQNKTKEGSAFYKHMVTKHNEEELQGKPFEQLFEVKVLKSYQKVFTRVVEEGTFMVSHKGSIMNSKSEWHQPKIIRTTILQGGAETRSQGTNVNYVATNSNITTHSINTQSEITRAPVTSVIPQLARERASARTSQRSSG